MFVNYLKIALRNLARHRFYTVINIFGLSLGIACCVILYQFISYHLSFDTYHKKAKSIYRVVDELHILDGSIVYETGAPMAMEAAIKQQMPQVKNVATLLADRSFTVAINAGEVGQKLFAEHENIALADRHWFELFDYKWLAGNPVSALQEPNTAVITTTLAKKYFGDDRNIIGRSLLIDNHLPVKITGLLDETKPNTDFTDQMFISMASFEQLNPSFASQMRTDYYFINSHTNIFVELNNNTSAETAGIQLTGIVRKALKGGGEWYNYKLLPLTEWHFDGRYKGVIQRPLLSALGLVGLLLIIIACVNFINMATAQSSKRVKEIGTRKVLGGTPASIFMQFITETACITLAATALALFWVQLTVPVLNACLQTYINVNFITNLHLPAFLLVIVIGVILLAGIYPALMLSRFKPVNALKNQLNSSTRSSLFTRKALIVAQNVIAQVLIVSTLLITLQTRFLRYADPGFDKDAIISLPIPDNAKVKIAQFKNAVSSNASVTDLTFCRRPALSINDYGGSVKYQNRDWETFTVSSLVGDAYYAKTFGMKIIAGRNIAEADSVREFLVNETLVKKLGVKNIESIIGQKLVCGELDDAPGTIVGVVRDFHSKSMYKPIEPQLITASRDRYEFAAIKIADGNIKKALNDIEKAWKDIYPGYAFEYHFLDQQIADFYRKEELLNKLIQASTGVAIAISCLGLLGLISLVTAQRTKEIGVRKVLGASVTQIVALLSGDFVKLICLSLFVALPLGWLLINKWLQNFAYHIDIPVWVFAMAALVSIMFALFTTGLQAIKAASANPVNSLRDE